MLSMSPRETLADTVATVLDELSVPVPTASMRIVASARRGQDVTAESLSRLAAAQREQFSRSRGLPRLCHTLDDQAFALTPRVWARGEWRLGRRIATRDALSGWQVGLAAGLCDEMLRNGDSAPSALSRLALEAVARVLGPVAGNEPGSSDQWEGFRREVVRRAPGPSRDSLTRQQADVERRLLNHQPPLPAFALYFGVTEDLVRDAGAGRAALVRSPAKDEEGEPFDAVVRRRVGGNTRRYSALVAYLQGYSFLMDELGRPPRSEEFADHWGFSLESVLEDEATFHAAFPEEPTPERLVRLLEEGLPRSGALGWLLGVEVIDASPQRAVGVVPAAGQRWTQKDGSAALTVIDADREHLTVALHRDGTTALNVMPRSALIDWCLDIPPTVWSVAFDVDVVPSMLIEPLTAAGIVPERLAQPGDPGPDSTGTVPGTVEARLVADDQTDAQRKVINALAGYTSVRSEAIRVRRLPTSAISD